MATAARRALTGSLLRAAAVSRPSAILAASPRAAVPAVFRTRITPSAAPHSLRWYSAGQDSSVSYSYGDIASQVRANDELEKGGKSATGKGKVIFVDVREPEELLETGRIPGAINIPVTTAAEGFQASEDDFVDTYGFEKPPHDAHLVFYCKAGIRARTALNLAQMAGYTSVGDYPGSWLDWESNAGDREVKAKQGSGWERVTGKH